MNQLENIPINIVHDTLNHDKLVHDTNGTTHTSLQIIALLQELQHKMQNLIKSDTTDSIDVHGLPLLPIEIGYLKEILGEGEVSVTVNALGTTKIHETSIPGIWWITHYNSKDEVMTELIEVTTLPEIIKTHRSTLPVGLSVLEKRLADARHDDG